MLLPTLELGGARLTLPLTPTTRPPKAMIPSDLTQLLRPPLAFAVARAGAAHVAAAADVADAAFSFAANGDGGDGAAADGAGGRQRATWLVSHPRRVGRLEPPRPLLPPQPPPQDPAVDPHPILLPMDVAWEAQGDPPVVRHDVEGAARHADEVQVPPPVPGHQQDCCSIPRQRHVAVPSTPHAVPAAGSQTFVRVGRGSTLAKAPGK